MSHASIGFVGLRIPSLTSCLVDNVLLHYVYPLLLDPIADARWRTSNMYESSAYMGDVEAVTEDEASVCLTVSLFLLRQVKILPTKLSINHSH